MEYMSLDAAAKKISPPRVDRFRDYREFLEARFIWEKRKNSKFSYQFCATRLKLTKGYLNRVINKQRHLGLDHVMPLARLFKLNEREQQDLLFRVLLSNTRERSLRKLFQTILNRIRGAKIGEEEVVSNFALGSEPFWLDWALMAIYGLVKLKGFSPDPEWICNKLGGEEVITRARVEKAWDQLLKLGLVQEQDGKIIRHEIGYQWLNAFDLNSDVIFKTGLQKAIDDLKTDLPYSRHMLVLGLNRGDREKIQELYRGLQNELMKIAEESDSPDSIFFVSNNFFQVTRV
jgi:uncharacterized protein (TIGR02147 family)